MNKHSPSYSLYITNIKLLPYLSCCVTIVPMTYWPCICGRLQSYIVLLYFSDCVTVAGVTNWPSAEGVYVEDSSLEDCRSTGKPRYRQLSGDSTIWYDGSRWLGSTKACVDSYSITQFGISSSSATPDLVTPGTWRMINTQQTSWVSSTITVTASTCGKL